MSRPGSPVASNSPELSGQVGRGQQARQCDDRERDELGGPAADGQVVPPDRAVRGVVAPYARKAGDRAEQKQREPDDTVRVDLRHELEHADTTGLEHHRGAQPGEQGALVGEEEADVGVPVGRGLAEGLGQGDLRDGGGGLRDVSLAVRPD